MNRRRIGCALGLGFALVVSGAAQAGAQTDTTRRAVSEQRIPVTKGQRITRESAGEVALSAGLNRIAALETEAASLRQRLAALEAENATLRSRSDADARMMRTLRDSLRVVGDELAAVREDIRMLMSRTEALEDSVHQLDRRLSFFTHRSIFGNSGFYVGIGTGANFTTGTLNTIGYREGLNVVVPIGWSKPGTVIGIRTEWAAQSFEGRMVSGFTNIDPMLYSGVAMLTLNFPLNSARTHLFYLMGGGGAYSFHRVGTSSALRDRLGDDASSVTKWGVTGGAGLELNILGATSIFVESSFINVFAERSELGTANGGRNLRWVPLVAGITLR